MSKRRFNVPSASALIAFEAAARHCNFSRAAEELATSQSAVSRHIQALEARLGAPLFHRQGKRLSLTGQGESFRRAVEVSLENIQSAAAAVSAAAADSTLTIACTHEVSHLFLLPRFEGLQAAVGAESRIRIMSYEYDALETSLDPRIDLLFTYRTEDVAPRDRAVVSREAVMPVCAPAFKKKHRTRLAKGEAHWGGLPILKLTKPNIGWSTWEHWFARSAIPLQSPNYIGFDNYVYLLEAAAAGRGLALGWQGFVDRHLESGTLVGLSGHFLPFDRALYAILTETGRTRPAARKCLAFLGVD